jgi:voltage-gated potassium channel
MPKNKKHSTLKQFIFHTLDILLITLTIIAVLLVFKNPFSTNIDAYVNYGFLGILFLQFLLAEKKKDYLKQNIWDIIIIVVLATPLLRVLRLFRLLRLVRAGLFLRKINTKSIRSMLRLSQKNISINMAIVFLVVLIFAGLEFFVEHGTNANFSNYKDAIWWSFATITTVGYGDLSPQTDLGRVIAVVLMFLGILLYGLLISNLTAWLMEKEDK